MIGSHSLPAAEKTGSDHTALPSELLSLLLLPLLQALILPLLLSIAISTVTTTQQLIMPLTAATATTTVTTTAEFQLLLLSPLLSLPLLMLPLPLSATIRATTDCVAIK